NGLDPLAYEVSQYLNTFGINGIIQSRFFDPLAGVRISEIIKQLKISVYNYGTIHPEHIYADLESGSYPYFPDTGVSYVSAEYLDALLCAATGYLLEDFGADIPNVIRLSAVDVFVVQHGDMTYMPVKLLTVTPYRNGYLATYQSDPAFSDSMLIDFDGDLREVAVMQAFLVRNPIDGRLNIVSNVPVWYASEPDNASYIIQPAMLQFNEFTVNALLQSEYYEPTDVDFSMIVMQAGENDAKIDYEAAYKKYGYTVEEGPGFKGLTGAYLFYLLEKYAATRIEDCAQYQNKYRLYLTDEDVYAIQSGGVTYERMRIIDFTFDGYDTYTMKYAAAEEDTWYYLSDSGVMNGATEMQAELCLGADGTFVVIRNSPLNFG
ncbi:MAG: hypothetical protein ILO42_04175, partial [Clostridia bacterium]|nr:hypothetical protein [Clostridia bacterium]